jgi:alkaline phosphatase
VLELCQRAGKATGLVTTSTFYDASPAAFAVHQPSRGLHVEIATEMFAVTRPEVIMGAGSELFDSADASLAVIAEDSGYSLVRSAAELEASSPSSRTRLLGVFATDFVPVGGGSESFTATPELERRSDSPDPPLAAMTRAALARLSRDPDGFFLFAEDELTDEIGHRAPAELEWAKRAIGAEVMALDAAVGVAIEWVLAHSSFDETLIVVLADHETGGYRFDHTLGPESGEFTAYSEAEDGARAGVHTRTPVEVRALGPGSDSIRRIESHADTHRLLLGTLR